MSLRAIASRLYKHGSLAIRHFTRNYNTTTITEKVKPIEKTGIISTGENSIVKQNFTRQYGLRNVGLQVGQHARRIFVDNVLNRVTNSLSSELRKRASRKLLFGDSGPFFALVGVSLASGTGILTKDDELEGVCWEIREAVSKIKWNVTGYNIDEERFENEEITLKDLTLGFPIAKGCSAVVYAAKFNVASKENTEEVDSVNDIADDNQKITIDITKDDDNKHRDSIIDYPFALKMMFNYDIQSNAMSILKAMYRETIPARHYYNREEMDWERSLSEQKPPLPIHPNIVAMYAVFADYIPNLRDSFSLYPDALPARINPDGYGRNMSLFLLMKRYHCSLNEYLKSNKLNIRSSILLLTQLLEGITHINLYGIAHRDLKSDNILLDLNDDDTTPVLVITDFGCCLADKTHGLQLPYNSMEIDKGGNVALMAPEIVLKTPGVFSILNYEKADLWAAGTIAYEIFGEPNPFYSINDRKLTKLKNTDYVESNLPPLPEDVPAIIKNLIFNLLQKNPNKRLNPEIAANVCQLYLWAPTSWFKSGTIKMPSSTEILQWLLCLTTKILCESRLANINRSVEGIVDNSASHKDNNYTISTTSSGRRTYPEYLLISSFLGRARLSQIRYAIQWIHDHME